jgi:hypothetical protein
MLVPQQTHRQRTRRAQTKETGWGRPHGMRSRMSENIKISCEVPHRAVNTLRITEASKVKSVTFKVTGQTSLCIV